MRSVPLSGHDWPKVVARARQGGHTSTALLARARLEHAVNEYIDDHELYGLTEKAAIAKDPVALDCILRTFSGSGPFAGEEFAQRAKALLHTLWESTDYDYHEIIAGLYLAGPPHPGQDNCGEAFIWLNRAGAFTKMNLHLHFKAIELICCDENSRDFRKGIDLLFQAFRKYRSFKTFIEDTNRQAEYLDLAMNEMASPIRMRSGLERLMELADSAYFPAIWQLFRFYKSEDFPRELEDEIDGWKSSVISCARHDIAAHIAELYESGIPERLFPDKELALFWWRLAADKNPRAAAFLGEKYLHGINVEKNPKKALRYYAFAAKAGNGDAAYALGCAYESSLGIKANLKEAVFWFSVAAHLGHRQANHHLFNIYQSGCLNGPVNAECAPDKKLEDSAKDNIPADVKHHEIFFEWDDGTFEIFNDRRSGDDRELA